MPKTRSEVAKDAKRAAMAKADPSILTPEREQEIDDLFALDKAVDPVQGGSQALPPVAPGTIFESAAGDGRPKFPPLPELKRGFNEIVRDIFDGERLVVLDEFKAIEESLSIKGALTPVAIQDAANNVESMANRAFRLYILAQNEYEAYVREIAVVESAMRDAATAQLEKEKANGSRSKMITEADVAATISQSFPDEWDDVQRRKGYAKGMLDDLNNLSSLAKSRCFSVSNMQRK